MARVVVTTRRVVNAQGIYFQGDRLSGSEADLKPLVDAEAAEWEGAEIEWTLTITPADYLERYPAGPNAELARQVLAAEEED